MAAHEQSMFGNAVSQILDSWTALKLAVDQGFGGPESQQKAIWMAFAIETWFKENDNLDPLEVEEFLEDVLNAEFDLRVEDNSVQEISKLICLYYRLCQENRVDELQQRLQTLPKASVHGCTQQGDMQEEFDYDEGAANVPSSSSSSTQQMAAAPSSSSDIVEDAEMSDEQPEDGWQVIRKGKTKKK